jgi:hypothetical protein
MAFKKGDKVEVEGHKGTLKGFSGGGWVIKLDDMRILYGIPTSSLQAAKATDLEPIPVEDAKTEPTLEGPRPYGWSPTASLQEIAKAKVASRKQWQAAKHRDDQYEARQYLKQGGGSRIAEAEARRILGIDSSHRARLHRALDAVMDARGAARDAGDYEVVWTDRIYKDHHKIFKNDPQGAPNNGEAKARKYAKQLELADSKDKYGNIRGPVNVRAIN